MLAHMGLRVVAAMAAVSVALAGCSSSQPTPTLAELDGAVSRMIPTTGVLGDSVADVSLRDASDSGEPMSFVASDDGVLVVYFGYTFCPDVCPTTLTDLRTALENLGDYGKRVEVAMVTVDPGRDTDEVITDYLHAFLPDGHPLRTEDDDELRAAADAFGVEFSVIEGANGVTEVAHSAFLYAVDDTGEIRAVWPFGVEPETISRDLELLLFES